MSCVQAILAAIVPRAGCGDTLHGGFKTAQRCGGIFGAIYRARWSLLHFLRTRSVSEAERYPPRLRFGSRVRSDRERYKPAKDVCQNAPRDTLEGIGTAATRRVFMQLYVSAASWAGCWTTSRTKKDRRRYHPLTCRKSTVIRTAIMPAHMTKYAQYLMFLQSSLQDASGIF